MNQPEEIDEDLEGRILALVVRKTRQKQEKITSDASLFHTLGVDGMDADDLLAAFRDEFGVDFSNFVFERHFGPEAGFNPFVRLIYNLSEPDKLRKVPITVVDLYEAAKTKKFPDLSNRAAK
jgi:acyl carrier protein